MIEFAKKVNWTLFALFLGGTIVQALYDHAPAVNLDYSVALGLVPYLTAQAAFYHPNIKPLKWLALSLAAFLGLGVILALLGMGVVTKHDRPMYFILFAFVILPLAVNVWALLKVPANNQLNLTPPNNGGAS